MMFPFGSIRPADRKANKNLLEHCICLRKIENKDEKQSDEMETGPFFLKAITPKKTKLKSSITTLQDLKNLMLESCFQIDSTLSKVVKDRKEEVAQRSGETKCVKPSFWLLRYAACLPSSITLYAWCCLPQGYGCLRYPSFSSSFAFVSAWDVAHFLHHSEPKGLRHNEPRSSLLTAPNDRLEILILCNCQIEF